MSLQSTDPIADLLTRIRNAALVGKTEVRVPTSKRSDPGGEVGRRVLHALATVCSSLSCSRQ